MPRGRKKGTKLVATRKKNYTFVDTRGYVRHKNIIKYFEDLEKKYKDDPIKDSIINAVKKELEDKIKEAKTKKNKLTFSKFQAESAKNKRKKLVISGGYDVDEFLKFYNLDEADFFDEDNWNKDIYKDPNNGKEYDFQYKYQGLVLKVR